MSVAHAVAEENRFAAGIEHFQNILSRLVSLETLALGHAAVEEMLRVDGTELMRLLFQDHLRLRAEKERQAPPLYVVGDDAIERKQRRDTERQLESVFGEVAVERQGYRARGATSRYPLDAELNLPRDKFSFGVRRLVAQSAAVGSFESVVKTIAATTGARIAKRQAECLTAAASVDFDAFYKHRREVAKVATDERNLVVLGFDGKGLVVWHDDLRPQTRRKAERRERKMEHRLGSGQKKHAKRVAQVSVVYTIEPWVRTPADIMGDLDGAATATAKRPRPQGKCVSASITADYDTFVGAAFDEALRRDVNRSAKWVVVVDGDPNQLATIEATARRKGVSPTIVLDIIHVIERLWQAATVFCGEGTPEREGWVNQRLRQILEGRAVHVAAGMRRSATLRGYLADERKAVDRCADYLLNYAEFMAYDRYLADGMPISTGVVEGTVRHLINDRMDITGARWRLCGAEAVLRLRSLYASGDLEEYWRFHEEMEYRRNHAQCYADESPPKSASPRRRHLHLVR